MSLAQCQRASLKRSLAPIRWLLGLRPLHAINADGGVCVPNGIVFDTCQPNRSNCCDLSLLVRSLGHWRNWWMWWGDGFSSFSILMAMLGSKMGGWTDSKIGIRVQGQSYFRFPHRPVGTHRHRCMHQWPSTYYDVSPWTTVPEECNLKSYITGPRSLHDCCDVRLFEALRNWCTGTLLVLVQQWCPKNVQRIRWADVFTNNQEVSFRNNTKGRKVDKAISIWRSKPYL